MSNLYRRKSEKFFGLLDENGDGALSLEDFYGAADRVSTAFGVPAGSDAHHTIHDAYTRLWNDIYAAMDSDGDRVVTFEEFIAAHEATILKPDDGYEKVRPVAHAFLRIADSDGDGTISRDEYVRIMTDAFRLSAEEAAEAFEGLDRDEQGHLTYGQIHRAAEGFFCTDAADTYGTGMFGRY